MATAWDGGLSAWDGGLSLWDSAAARWDGGLSTWDGGLTKWDGAASALIPARWDGGLTAWDSGLTTWDGATAARVPAGSSGTQRRGKQAPRKPQEQELQDAASAIHALAKGIISGTPDDIQVATQAVAAHVDVADQRTKLAVADAMVKQGMADLQQAWATLNAYYATYAKQKLKREQEEYFFLMYL